MVEEKTEFSLLITIGKSMISWLMTPWDLGKIVKKKEKKAQSQGTLRSNIRETFIIILCPTWV